MIGNKCKICGNTFKSKTGLKRHLSLKEIDIKEYYDKYYKIDGEGVCQMLDCNKEAYFDKQKIKYKHFCKRCAFRQNEEWHIIKYGEKIGKEKYKEISKKKSITLENMINKYGEEEGTKRYNNYIKKLKFANTEEGYINRYGEEEGKQKYIDWKNKTAITLENMISKYGEEEGTKRYNAWKESNSITLENMISKYGEEEGTKMYIKANKNLKKALKGLCNLQWFENKYKNKELALKMYNNYWSEHLKNNKTSTPGFFKASKQSLEVFFPLIDWLLENKICTLDEIYLGINNSFEYMLCDDKFKFFYDFTIPKLNIIIEFNGEHVHPNPIWLEEDIDKWNNWKQVFNKITANEVFEKNQIKVNLAKKRGYKLLEIWSSIDWKDNLKICKEFIKSY